MTDNEIIKAWDILCKMDFFGGQRAGRELWSEKPTAIQDADIESFSNDVAFLKDFIDRQKAEIERLKGWESLLKAEKHSLIKAEAIKQFANRVKPIIIELVGIMWDDDIRKCQIEGCHYPSNIPCGNEICIRENELLWVAKIDELVKEMVGED